MKVFTGGLLTLLQIGLLSAIWLIAEYMVKQFNFPIPANLAGMLILLLCLFLGVIKASWLRKGATWLLAEMLLFFVPAVVAVVKYQSLMETEGLRIFVVLLISTVLVLGITAAVVDRVYRFELQLSRRKSNRHYQKLTKHTEQ